MSDPEENMKETHSSGTLDEHLTYIKNCVDEMERCKIFFKDYVKVMEKLKAQADQIPGKGNYLTSETLANYLPELKAFKAKVDTFSSFLDGHINLLENNAEGQPDRSDSACSAAPDSPMDTNSDPPSNLCHDKKQESHRGQKASDKRENESNKPNELKKAYDWVTGYFSSSKPIDVKEVVPTEKHSNIWNTRILGSAKEKLKYQILVSGETFNAHRELLEHIKRSIQDLTLVEVHGRQKSLESQVIILFCPIVSRVGTDVNEAMKAVKDNRPVILVLMHHAYEAKYVSSVKSWSDYNILLHVNVFFHETKRGLIQCEENDKAMLEIQNKILEKWTKK